MKRKLLKPIYECRCTDRLQTQSFTRLAHTVLGRQEGGDLRADHHGGQSAEGMNLFPGVTPTNGQDEPPQEKKEAVVRRTSNPASSHGADLDTSSLRTHAPYTRAPQACPHLVSSGLMN